MSDKVIADANFHTNCARPVQSHGKPQQYTFQSARLRLSLEETSSPIKLKTRAPDGAVASPWPREPPLSSPFDPTQSTFYFMLQTEALFFYSIEHIDLHIIRTLDRIHTSLMSHTRSASWCGLPVMTLCPVLFISRKKHCLVQPFRQSIEIVYS